jgi:8-oxo-dGTP pyrophosphatase MutT (NUDIX family)
MDIGETIAEAGVRETREETGIDCETERLVGVYTNPRLHGRSGRGYRNSSGA